MARAQSQGTLQKTENTDDSKERQLADVSLDPLFGAAVIASSFGEGISGQTDFTAIYEALHDRAKAIRGNKLASAENMLTALAAALNAIFVELARRSGANMARISKPPRHTCGWH